MSGNFEYFYTRLFVSSVSDFIVSLSIHSDLYRFWKVTFLLIKPKPTTKTNFHILPGQNMIQKSEFFRVSWTDENAGRTIRVYWTMLQTRGSFGWIAIIMRRILGRSLSSTTRKDRPEISVDLGFLGCLRPDSAFEEFWKYLASLKLFEPWIFFKPAPF